MKRCFKCQQMKPLDEFYAHPMMKDGHLNKCKECTRSDVHRNYMSRIEHYRQYERQRNQTPERRLAAGEYQRVRRLRNPDKFKAWTMVNNAVRDGRLMREPCQNCGSVPAQAHHDDYSKPLDVRWLCFFCHRKHAHGQNPAPVS